MYLPLNSPRPPTFLTLILRLAAVYWPGEGGVGEPARRTTGGCLGNDLRGVARAPKAGRKVAAPNSIMTFNL